MQAKQLNTDDESGSTWTKWDTKKHRFMQKIWWHRRYSDWYYNVKYGIRNLFKWFKVVWRDRDYDHSYILTALQFKIKNTRILTENNQRHVGYEEDVANMKRCEELLKNMLEDNYAERCGYDSNRTEIGWIPAEDHPDCYEMINTDENPQSDDELTDIFKKARELKKAEKAELFKILEDHVEGWWD